MNDKVIPVKVALRIRPLVPKERGDGCTECLRSVKSEPQVILGKDKCFTYDYVFSQSAPQIDVYEQAVQPLLDSLFKGYNATVLAYGQTGSGKTYTMGTAFDTAVSNIMPGEEGIIPRAIAYLFDRIEQAQREHIESGDSTTPPKFSVLVQFMELYNEEINDLFASLPAMTAISSNSLAFTSCTQDGGVQTTEQFVYNKTTVKTRIEIHEDHAGGINVQGCSVHEVRSLNEV